ncbi:Gypsy retrotransposon integrase-like protein 1 [Vitis vinifera]|uniref:Gypsy retrotransposon integrase-like protein 1 n=1 Tax=Vitis vinifera TaxID=29760 RepID=A0A438FRS1_VITVI|nr:Gypsy retrotransposon integrase-like protein 1 [Vitis vinifera]
MALGCMLAQLDDLGKERAIYYLSKRMLESECKYIMIERLCLALVWATRRLRHYMTEYSVLLVSRLVPLRYLFDRPVLTGRLMRWLISDDRSVDDDFPDEQLRDHIPRSVRLAFSDHHLLTNNIVEYEACITGLEIALDLGIRQYIHLPRAENQFADALATLASMIVIPARVTIRPLLIETRSALAYYYLIGEIEDQIELPWRSPDGLLLLCLDRTSVDRVMREVHAGVCGPNMGGHMLVHKIMRAGYFWFTMETDCCQFVQRCRECQMHGDLIHVPPSELHALTSPWPFSVWGVDIIGKISPKSSSGHEYILVAIDYFTKWVEAASYARLTAARVAKFIRSHIICQYGVPHELISNRGVNFRGEVDTAIEATNKNIKRILGKMVETSRDWSEKLPFALWVYRTSFRTSTGATPYSLVYGMEAVLPVEIEMRS